MIYYLPDGKYVYFAAYRVANDAQCNNISLGHKLAPTRGGLGKAACNDMFEIQYP